MNGGVDLDSLQGWLVKEKSKHSKFNVFGNEDTRWFKVQNLAAVGARVEELALVYFLNEKSRDAKGWIFLKDISEISDDGDAFKIVSYARTMVLQATTRAEHRFWVLNLVKLSSNCQYRGSTISASDYDTICGSRRRATPPDEAKAVGGALLKVSAKRNDGAELSSPPSPRSVKQREKPPLARVDSREREDHRMDDYPKGGGAPSSSARLREHIAGSASPRRGARSRSPANRSIDSGGSDGADLGDTRDDRIGNSRDNGTLYDGAYGAHKMKEKVAQPSEFEDEEELAYSEAKRGAAAKDNQRPVTESSWDNDSPRTASPPAEKKKKPPPMPAGPAPSMPRKARDVLATAVNDGDSRAASPRRSIDSMLAVDRRSDVKHHSSDEDELGTDFIKEERRRYGSGASGASLNAAESKDGGLPPRAPRSPREPVTHPDTVSSGMHRSGRSSTPPRRGADPGSAVDPNFVAENWDNDDEDDDAPVVHRNSKGGARNSRTTPVSIGSSVKADDNWLDDNFDDD